MYDKPLQTYETRAPSRPTPTWALVLINGIAAVGLGLIFLASPGASLKLLMKFLGLFFLIGGFFSLFSIAFSPEHKLWKLIAGLAGIIGGLIVMEHPAQSAILVDTALVYALAGFGIVMGAAQIIQAFKGGGWGIGFLGILILGFGLIILFSPLIGAVVLPFVLAVFGIVGGLIAIFIAFRLRRQDKEKTAAAVK